MGRTVKRNIYRTPHIAVQKKIRVRTYLRNRFILLASVINSGFIHVEQNRQLSSNVLEKRNHENV